MLFMVVERFRGGTPAQVGERFRAHGRLIPVDAGVDFVASWMSRDGSCCYQLMESPTREALDPWIAKWADLVEFEVIGVMPGAEFWANRSPTHPT